MSKIIIMSNQNAQYAASDCLLWLLQLLPLHTLLIIIILLYQNARYGCLNCFKPFLFILCSLFLFDSFLTHPADPFVFLLQLCIEVAAANGSLQPKQPIQSALPHFCTLLHFHTCTLAPTTLAPASFSACSRTMRSSQQS